ncbi:MAG TPA: vWA domain-containing protein [Ignavibacteriaceae bacterium]|nr:vWA domain-containing protein [Ignavibacteriaceae bacterium]
MSRSFLLLALIIYHFFPLPEIPASVKITSKDNLKSSVQIALLLDTSNSMDGLIDQAKTQLWKIVNEMARSKRGGHSINLNVAIYEYGNDNLPSGEGFIRLVSPLTNDLDKISEELFKLKTNGGSEYCGTVISEAVKDLKWTKDNNQLKIIFIAGNEPFDQGNADYKKSCREAIAKGIIVNTIYCGNYEEGKSTYWKDGADLADGKYMNIDQNQGISFIETPYDNELASLGEQLNNTYIGYGVSGKDYKKRQAEQDVNAANLSPSILAERTVTKSGSQYKNDSWDLVDAEKEGKVKISEIPAEQLPEEMQKMSKEERVVYVEKKAEEREKIQNKIEDLNKKRTAFLIKNQAENKDNTFDAAILKILREQASKKKYSFE